MPILFARGGAGIEALFFVAGFVVIVFVAAFIWKWKDNIRFWTIAVKGEKHVGWIVQANDILYQKGDKEDLLPALIIFSLDEDAEYDEPFMESIIRYLVKLKENGTADEKLKPLAKEIRDERWRKNRVRKIPKSITDGADVYMAHVLIARDTLPKGKITRPYIRIKVLRDDVERGADHIDYLDEDRALPFNPNRKSKRARSRDDDDSDE